MHLASVHSSERLPHVQPQENVGSRALVPALLLWARPPPSQGHLCDSSEASRPDGARGASTAQRLVSRPPTELQLPPQASPVRPHCDIGDFPCHFAVRSSRCGCGGNVLLTRSTRDRDSSCHKPKESIFRSLLPITVLSLICQQPQVRMKGVQEKTGGLIFSSERCVEPRKTAS